MIAKSIFIFFFLTIFSNEASCQYLKFNPYRPYKWMIGVGWNVVDDDGRSFSHLLDVKNSWNYLPYPTTLSIDRYLAKGLSVDLEASYNVYSAAKCINGARNRPGQFAAIDLYGKYSFYKMFEPKKWLDPYVMIGAGVTYREAYPIAIIPTANVGLGLNILVKNFGIRLQTSCKLGLMGAIYTTDADYVQHSVSLVYRVQGKSKKDNSFSKSKHKWTHKKTKFKSRSK